MSFAAPTTSPLRADLRQIVADFVELARQWPNDPEVYRNLRIELGRAAGVHAPRDQQDHAQWQMALREYARRTVELGGVR